MEIFRIKFGSWVLLSHVLLFWTTRNQCRVFLWFWIELVQLWRKTKKVNQKGSFTKTNCNNFLTYSTILQTRNSNSVRAHYYSKICASNLTARACRAGKSCGHVDRSIEMSIDNFFLSSTNFQSMAFFDH